MMTELYQKYYKAFYPPATQKIISLLENNIADEQSVLEVGFGSGHLLFQLAEAGYRADGIEIRKEAYHKAFEIFDDAGFASELFEGDFREFDRAYDIIYTTGLVQCLKGNERDEFIAHIASLCKKAIIVIPEIVFDRNIESDGKIAVSGCPEYSTCKMITELYKHFNYVREGRWSEEELNLPDAFRYYICINI